MLAAAPEILRELQEYKGASEEIREAIANPRNEEMQEYAWAAVLPLVAKLKKFYEFSIQLGKFKVFCFLCQSILFRKEIFCHFTTTKVKLATAFPLQL